MQFTVAVMAKTNPDHGVIHTLMVRFNEQRYPTALALEKKLASGECLNAWEIEHLKSVLAEIREMQPLLERHPEYRHLAARAISMYAEIAKRALGNEKGL
jgi:hypothetical protein